MGNDTGNSVSVVLAMYNGEKYLRTQLSTILPQLEEKDELIIMDDGSLDQSISIVEEMANQDQRIHLVRGNHVGVNANFFRGIKEAKGDIICLSDQDDIWHENKLERIREKLVGEKMPCVLMHDAQMVSAEGEKLDMTMFEWRPYRKGVLRNWWKNSYTGCRMVINQAMKELIADAPTDIPMYDQWVGLQAERLGKTIILEEVLMDYRRHTGNVTDLKHQSIQKMMNDRIKLLVRYLIYTFRR